VIARATLVAGLAAVLVLPLLGERVIGSGDEARFAILAQDMLARGTWFDARIRDQRYRNKPLLYPWAIKLLSMPGGQVTETTAQLPVVGAAVAAVFLTTMLGQQLFSATAGVAAGLITATSYAFFAHSQILLPDMLVLAFGLGALCAFWAAVHGPPNRYALVAFYVAVALGVAAKGPMGLLPVLVVVAWLLTEDGVRGLRRLASPLGALAFVVVTSVWLLPYLAAGSHSFARGVVWDDWLAWYLGRPRPLSMLNMLLDGAKGFMPWTALLILPLLVVRRHWRDGPLRLAFLAWILPLICVTLALNHRERYLLPTYPAAALLVGWWCARESAERTRAEVVVAWLTGVAMLAAIGALAWPWAGHVERQLIDGFWWKATALALGALAVTGYAVWMLLTGRPRTLVAGVALGMAPLLVGGTRMYDGWVTRSEDYPGLAVLTERYAGGGDVAITGGRFFSIDFYLGRALTPVNTASELDAWVARPDHPVVVASERAWSTLRNQVREDVEVVDAMSVRNQLMFVLRRSNP
jgi:4-amino-4-deoxy-L-arabinose transferase-like glycosyltransferase